MTLQVSKTDNKVNFSLPSIFSAIPTPNILPQGKPFTALYHHETAPGESRTLPIVLSWIRFFVNGHGSVTAAGTLEAKLPYKRIARGLKFSVETVKYAVRRLEKTGLLNSRRERSADRTKWYYFALPDPAPPPIPPPELATQGPASMGKESTLSLRKKFREKKVLNQNHHARTHAPVEETTPKPLGPEWLRIFATDTLPRILAPKEHPSSEEANAPQPAPEPTTSQARTERPSWKQVLLNFRNHWPFS